MAKIINATPHVVNFLNEDGKIYRSFEPEISVRVESHSYTVADLEGIPVDVTTFGEVEGLPEEKRGTFYIVSRLVKTAAKGRHDLLVPGQQVRDEQGRVIGCRSLSN